MTIEQLAQSGKGKGFVLADNNIIVGVYNEYPFTLQLKKNIVTVQFNVSSANINKLSKSVKNQLGKGYRFSWVGGGSLSILFKDDESEDLYRKAIRFLDFITNEMKNYRKPMRPSERCYYCKKESCDSAGLVSGTNYVPVHKQCMIDDSVKVTAKAEAHESQKFYLGGLVGALLGAILGTIPAILAIVLLKRDVGILYFLIPLASFKGYELLKGPLGNAARITVIICSVAAFVVMQPLYVYLYSMLEDLGYSISDIIYLYLNYFSVSDIIRDAAFGAIFLIIGLGSCFKAIGAKSSDLVRESTSKLDTIVSLNHPAPDSVYSDYRIDTNSSIENTIENNGQF